MSQPAPEHFIFTGLLMVPRQLDSPEHATVQPVAALQSTPAAQLFLPVQSTAQATPAGQTTCWGQSFSRPQVIWQTPVG